MILLLPTQLSFSRALSSNRATELSVCAVGKTALQSSIFERLLLFINEIWICLIFLKINT